MESIKVVISILILIIASFSIGKCEGKKAIIPVCDERVDTLVIRDTITQYEPIYKESDRYIVCLPGKRASGVARFVIKSLCIRNFTTDRLCSTLYHREDCDK